MSDIPPEYQNVTLKELLVLFTGPNALPIPEELQEWLECAELLAQLVHRRDRNNEARRPALH